MIPMEPCRLAFERQFGMPAVYASRAPGRVNLIGEHIDYLGGLVLPIAIDRHITALAAPPSGARFTLHSASFPEPDVISFEKDETKSRRELGWGNYALGVVREFADLGHPVPPLNILIESEIPSGSGLSSSAAIEIALATIFNEASGAGLSPRDLAQIGCRAENKYAGIPCGIMDQAAVSLGRAGNALLLDCRDLTHKYIPIPPQAAFVIAHSGIPRRLAATAYRHRRKECATALEAIKRLTDHDYATLCEVPITVFDPIETHVWRPFRGRARYAIEEHARVSAFCQALVAGDLSHAGALMNESHYGLRDLYDVSCVELDALTELARNIDGVHGSRLTGAGFGGCSVSLADADKADRVVEALRVGHPMKSVEPLIFVSAAANGAHCIDLRP